MQIILTKKFLKQYAKLPKKTQESFKKRRDLLIKNELDPRLNSHKLHGKYSEYRSINITGNIRVVYKIEDKDVFIFYAIGSHSELYS